MQVRKVTLIGAGPVGSLLAIFLARRGFEVEIHERRPDMRIEAVEAGRSINLALSARGIHALRQVGLDRQALGEAVPMYGRMMHSVEGELAFQPYGKEDSDCIYSVSRGGLNRLLMSAAEATGAVKIRFRQRATGMDFGAGRVLLKDELSGDAREISAPVVFGTDGSSSAIRSDLIRATSGHESQQYLDYGYKELELPAGPEGAFQLGKNALHIWPRGTFMLIALPNFGGSFTCTLFLPLEGPDSFESLRSPKEVRNFFTKFFPDVMKCFPALEKQFLEHPLGKMVTVRCSPWSFRERCLMLGDAAHAIVPFFGQGMNCGFEDCSVLDGMIGKNGSSLDAGLFEDFGRLRKPDADAIAEMAIENFAEMRDKVADPQFLLQKQVERILQREFPEQYVSRYSLVTFSRVPYLRALEAGVAQSEILSRLCRDLKSAEQVDLALARQLIGERLRGVVDPPLTG